MENVRNVHKAKQFAVRAVAHPSSRVVVTSASTPASTAQTVAVVENNVNQVRSVVVVVVLTSSMTPTTVAVVASLVEVDRVAVMVDV